MEYAMCFTEQDFADLEAQVTALVNAAGNIDVMFYSIAKGDALPNRGSMIVRSVALKKALAPFEREEP